MKRLAFRSAFLSNRHKITLNPNQSIEIKKRPHLNLLPLGEDLYSLSLWERARVRG